MLRDAATALCDYVRDTYVCPLVFILAPAVATSVGLARMRKWAGGRRDMSAISPKALRTI
jgi:hypothetical protein